MPEQKHTSHFGFYRTGLMTPEHRRFVTVGRKHLLDDVLDSLRKNAGRTAKHHALFIGLRGMGKTHLLSLIEDEITQTVSTPEEAKAELAHLMKVIGG